MRAVDIIGRKRSGLELSAEEISFLIDGYSAGTVPDYQMAAWAMAVVFRGMTAAETAELTMAMARSGDQLDLSAITGIKVDKHSTGGVGDKTTLILGPLVASAGVPVAKMSGRGLGHTGGTIDKLESIRGFRTELTTGEFIKQVNELGLAVVGQSGDMAPADKKLYALRDVTATVESVPLIASSVMSKKIAAGADAIVLDVKAGGGAFMKTVEDAERLAQAMVAIGTETGRHTVAVISDMNQPLGYMIGNALEVAEAVETLRGSGPKDLEELCTTLAAHMVVLGGKAQSFEEARLLVQSKLQSGEALAKMSEFVAAQGGDPAMVNHTELLPKAPYQLEVKAARAGYITAIEAEELGLAAMHLGAGRPTKEAEIDHAVGIQLTCRLGDRVEQGDVIALLHARQDGAAESRVAEAVRDAFLIADAPASARPLVLSVVTKDGIERFG
ncbi:pyrimidine-nucleoside phosphorylase [Paenibacillus sambharensis]|uniref:Pyrimidine-nucleoside phosphorylase n=1 Tax=Paenibacillus sambharensis TaxID=1803190 RepID=A0A2W1L0M1_9BACL|nr:pyrimidine-nucleoside phosphorylase [Paenibacillus sambharensis]PZD93468.1 pyrimidine-nucleoside phosphorylase [Paenibacillus sambharensis]